MSNELVLMAHPTFGVLAILAAVWVFVEALNAGASSQRRLWLASLVVAVCIWVSYVVGGYWYVTYYSADKAKILGGPWPFAHNFFMEAKEHVFLSLLLLATFLPIAASNNVAASKGVRNIVLWSAALVVLLGLAMEGAGSFIAMGVKVAILSKAA